MIVAREFVGPIIRGEITMVSRKMETTGRRCPFEVGKLYPVQTWRDNPDGRRVPTEARCRIMVVEVSESLLHLTTDAEARAHGFKDRGEMFDWWRDTYGDGPGTEERPVEVPVWVVVFQVDRQERPKFLARGSGGDEHGYVTSAYSQLGDDFFKRRAVLDELEAVPDSDLKVFAADALQKDVRRVEKAERVSAARPLSERVADLERAQRKGRNVAPALAAIRRRVEAAEARLRRDAA